MESGLHSARFITASTSAGEFLFDILRRCGFAAYDWHMFWKVKQKQTRAPRNIWRKPMDMDAPAVLELQKRILTPAVQAVSQINFQHLPDIVLRVDGELLGFATLLVGRYAIVITPFLSSKVDNPVEIISSLYSSYFTGDKHVFFRQTGSTAWLTNHLEKIATLFLKREELLVKHFTVRKSSIVNEMNAAVNPRHVDPAMPFTQSTGSEDTL